ncbi:MAG TPA: hypothetical protein VKZ94_18200 [Advenella sp.]|nr:hypothetical protein [Advenella sp.]
MLQLIGWLFSGVFKFMPGVPTIAVYGVALLFAIGLPSGWAYYRGSEGKAAAVEREKAQCEVKIARMETAAERTIADILSSVDGITDASKDVAQYCERHPTLCRSEK